MMHLLTTPLLLMRFSQVIYFSLIVFGMFTLKVMNTETISGVVNDYTIVTAINTQSIEVQDATAFSPGDRLLMIQMKGASISLEDDSTYGNISDINYAGNYEFNTVREVSGSLITLESWVCGDYYVPDLVQAIRVPVYSDVTIDQPLEAYPWDGTTGGIIAIEATGTVTLSSDMDVTSVGFRGGDRNGNAAPGGLTYLCEFNSGKGGIKGEGVSVVTQDACRGKLANGGGGGNDHNGGGGGGANYGNGGKGGHGWFSNNPVKLSDTDKGGRGGLGLSGLHELGIPKLFLGGGGGGGHQNNGASLPAANGAGIIIIKAQTLEANVPVTIKANAINAEDIYVNDGAGGGGAGGSVLLDVDNFINPENLTIDVSGGDGASVKTANQHGPGGGGSGGYINSTTTLPSAITTNTSGGQPGLFISTRNYSNPYHNTSHGATAGEDGAVIENLVLQYCSQPPLIDLDTINGGYDYETTFYFAEDSFVGIADPQIGEIEDLDDIYMQFAIIELLNPVDGDDEGLIWTGPLPNGLLGSVSEDGLTITIQNEGSLRDYMEAISKIGYANNRENPSLTTRLILVIVNDGGAESNTATSYILMSDQVLPVVWEDIRAINMKNHSMIIWKTAGEINSNYFEVERSADQNIFSGIGRVNATGNSTIITTYRWADHDFRSAGRREVYYRIKQVDLDGLVHYSPVVRLNSHGHTPLNLKIFTSPYSESIILNYGLKQRGKTRLRITDFQGKTIFSNEIDSQSVNGKMEVDVSGWARGIYFAELITRSESMAVRFVII